jgi:hypothetical protein
LHLLLPLSLKSDVLLLNLGPDLISDLDELPPLLLMIVRLLFLEGDALLILQDTLLGVGELYLRLNVLRKLLTVSS